MIFDWLTLPQRVLGDENGWVRGLECVRTELGEPDASGRRRPVPVPGSEFTLERDLVVIALGTNPNPLDPADDGDLDVDGHGCIVADPRTGATSRDGVFAGGDIVTGAATVILAMGAGRRAATAIHSYLQERAAQEGAAVNTTVDNQGDEELERGFAEGLDWAREFATALSSTTLWRTRSRTSTTLAGGVSSPARRRCCAVTPRCARKVRPPNPDKPRRARRDQRARPGNTDAMRMAFATVGLAVASMLAACSSTPSHRSVPQPSQTVPSTNAAPTSPPTQVRAIACPAALGAAFSRGTGTSRSTFEDQVSAGLTTCSLRTLAGSSASCTGATVTINTNPQAFTDFNRWVVETAQNGNVKTGTDLFPHQINGIGVEADWVPGTLTFGAATETRWVTVRLTCPPSAAQTLALAEALARPALPAS